MNEDYVDWVPMHLKVHPKVMEALERLSFEMGEPTRAVVIMKALRLYSTYWAMREKGFTEILVKNPNNDEIAVIAEDPTGDIVPIDDG